MPEGVRLLGTPRVWHDGDWHDLPLDKRLGLVTYLACAGTWVTRERVSFLFWPDVPNARARINLRQLLARARSLPLADRLEADDVRLRWRGDSDVSAFRRALAESEWRLATVIYAGDLAQGLEVDDASELASWLAFERAQLREAFRRAALRHAEAAEAAGRPEEAEATYDRLLALDPLDEAVVQASLRLRVRFGSHEDAARLYRRFAAQLRDELGLEPAAATLEILHAAPRDEPAEVPGLPPASAGGLREPLTSFVGREEELDLIAARLTGDECRLLTLVGPGGVGKTRLALRAAERLRPAFPDGVIVVPLAGVAAPEGVSVAVAQAAGVRLRGGPSPLDQVVAALRDRHALLLLDEFEHLLGAALVVDELLASCRGLRALVTSRERLRLQAEWLLPLAGLPVPPEDVVDGAEALAYAAARLLSDRARQVAPGFRLDGDDLPPAVALCRFLDGLPLGVELAAASLRTLAPRELLAALTADAGTVASDALDVPTRHRSLGAAFEHSWRLLSDAEREAYRRLAAFHGDFDEAAAAAVAGAKRPVLRALAEKSLLLATDQGRYALHPLLRELARHRLEADAGAAAVARDAHARHYLRRLASWQDRVNGPEQARMIETLAPDYPDLRAALAAGIERAWYAECHAAMAPLLFFHGIQGRFFEGAEVFAAAASILAADDRADASAPESDTERVLLLAEALMNLAWFQSALGRLDDAIATAERGLALAAPRDAPDVELRGWQVLGTIAARRGDDANALAWLSHALALAERTGDDWSISLVSGNLGLAELKSGRLDDAERHFRQSLAHNEALGNVAGIVNDHDYLGRLSQPRRGGAGAASARADGLKRSAHAVAALAEPDELQVLRVPADVAAHERAHGDGDEAGVAHVVEGRAGQGAGDAAPLDRLGHPGVLEHERGAYPGVLEHGEVAVLGDLEAPGPRVVDDLDARVVSSSRCLRHGDRPSPPAYARRKGAS